MTSGTDTTRNAPASPAGEAAAGTVAPGFEPVREQFARLLAQDDTFSGQFCAYEAGRRVAEIWGGEDSARDSLQGVFSATKGVAAVCIGLLVQRGDLDLDAPVSRYWPEFAQAGKETVTVRLALSHQAGLVGAEPQLTLDELVDHPVAAARLARQRPHWHPGAAHGYHALTIGVLMDELVRRITSTPIARFFMEEVAGPRHIDFYIATPEDMEPRVRPVLPMRPTAEQQEHLSTRRLSPDSLTGLAFNARADAEPLPNRRIVRAAGHAAVGGVGSADGLARLYAMCIGEVDGFPRLLSPETVDVMAQIQAAGPDLVLWGEHRRWAVVFQKAADGFPIGSHQAFGHEGVGGAIGAADPSHDLAYAWIPRRMTFPGGADPRGLSLAGIVRECLTEEKRGS